MTLAVTPPVAPMLATLARELPLGGYVYEPKWDGFRCLAFRDGDRVDLRSRRQRPLARYFPEIVEALLGVERHAFTLDGELLVFTGHGGDFEALLGRLHPAASRVELLRHEAPASFVAFDLLAVDDRDLRGERFRERRKQLDALLAAVDAPLFVTPATDDPDLAGTWLRRFDGGGIDGVVAKPADLPYVEGKRRLVKVKHERTATCVVGGFRWLVDRPLPSSLLLGLYDDDGALRHVGIAASFGERLRHELLARLDPLVVPLAGHPWESGFLLAGGSVGRLPGAAGRWAPGEMPQDWTPVAPELACDVSYEQVDADRMRHPARFRRWRPDVDPLRCRLDQLATSPAPIAELLA
jgi:ATP-dependent DNA ligase